MTDEQWVRFRQYVRQPSGSSCWIWIGGRDRDGYGQFQLKTRTTRRAHRLAYQHLVGKIPPGLELDHLCKVRSCVNPSHLEPVTTKENLHRARPWASKADRTHCSYGHAFDEKNTYIRKNGTRACKRCHADREAARRKR